MFSFWKFGLLISDFVCIYSKLSKKYLNAKYHCYYCFKKIKYGTCTFRNLISRNFNWVFGFNLYYSVVGGMLISVPQTSIDREGNFSLSELHKEHRVTTSLPLLLQLTSPTEDRSLLCLVISKSLIAIVCPV